MPIPSNQLLVFPVTEEEAEKAYQTYRNLDPFPDIEPALLNAADIADYVAKTGMIFPFNLERLGPASYEMVLGGETLYWDEDGKKCGDSSLQEKCPLVIAKNSITYVSVRETFRLPHYLAVRFNLRVRHVHRGLLLGTGPLVDPGFQGKLMIPIHNLTENEYTIFEGEDLISVEFTKVSKNIFFKPRTELEKKLISRDRYGNFVENSKKNSKKSFEDLLKKELPIGIGKVMSSLAGTLAKTKLDLEKNQKFISKIRNYSLIAIFPIFISLITLYTDISSYITNANKYVSDATMIFKSVREDGYLKKDIVSIKDDINRIEKILNSKGEKTNNSDYKILQNDINDIKMRVVNLEKNSSIIDENQTDIKKDEKD